MSRVSPVGTPDCMRPLQYIITDKRYGDAQIWVQYRITNPAMHEWACYMCLCCYNLVDMLVFWPCSASAK